ncbi:hypothetical protein F4805DRAFT_413388 [Annulohypoxylon moriforme]|nr:hypothetical protein F4805DRAFT_413388 [Annulohypoxylon moriforme]
MAFQGTIPATVRNVLTQNKPPVSCNDKNRQNTSRRLDWPDIEFIEIWHEFSLDNLNNEYSHLLDCNLGNDTTPPQAYQELHGASINKLNDINLLIGWNGALMQATLNSSKAAFEHCKGLGLYHAYTTADKTTIASIEGSERKIKVDHVIALDKFPRRNLVIGLGKPSPKFSMGPIVRNGGCMRIVNSQHTLVLGQLGYMCKNADTPYGYIQTDQELVACYFKKNGDSGKYGAYVMPIPWSSHGPTVLTTDLALWWLCMKALSPPIDPNDEYIEALGHPAYFPELDLNEIENWKHEVFRDTY